MDERINSNLIEANTKLVDENKILKRDKEMLQRRINKAVEYIEIIQYNEGYGVKEKDYLNLLDILKGDYVYEQ